MSRAAAVSKLEKHLSSANSSQQGLADSALQGVTVGFISQVYGMEPNKVKRLLRNCPILESRKRGRTQVQHLYDLATASKYLVEPEISVEEILKKIKVEDLPNHINGAFWDAQLKRQRWEENAGQLWRTSTIRGTIGGMFQAIKFTISLWGDTIERQTGLSDEQTEILQTLADDLQQRIFEKLEENAKEKMTGPQLAELESILEEAKRPSDFRLNKELAEVLEEEDTDDDFGSSLL